MTIEFISKGDHNN